MKLLAVTLLLLCIAAVPAIAQVVYDNGPINGTTDAWTVNFGFAVSETFTVTHPLTTVTGFAFGAWVFPGDVLESAEILIGTSEFDGSIFDGLATFTQGSCVGNQFGFNVCTETGRLNGPFLPIGNYWITVENATVNTGDPIYWDENSGRSSASQNSVGTIPSEAFTVLGFGETNTTTSGTVPEPSSIMLFGAGILGLAGVLRRKLF